MHDPLAREARDLSGLIPYCPNNRPMQWVNRHQLDVIEYLKEENRVLKERLGGARLRFTDAEHRRLARKARALGRKALNELETLVTPDTLLRWYRASSGGPFIFFAACHRPFCRRRP